MKAPCPKRTILKRSPQWWRIAFAALGTLILCSCQTARQQNGMTRDGTRHVTRHGMTSPDGSQPCPPAEVAFETMPPSAYSGPNSPPFEPVVNCPPGMEMGVPLPYSPAGPWAPPGQSQPWPIDEYLTDGGDRFPKTAVMPDWEVRGLNLEDTVAHFDTLDGQTIIEPSNRVHIYSPRFGSVRHVVNVQQHEQRKRSQGIHFPTQIVQHDDLQIAQSRQQNVQPLGQITNDQLTIFRTRQGDGLISQSIGPEGFFNDYLPFEDFSLIRLGQIEESERAWLAEGIDAAVAWIDTQAVQVILDKQAASETAVSRHAGTLYSVDEPPGKPKLRLVKVASTSFAEPGDEVAFTLRFDNIGNQPIGNVTLIDNLTTRLEYIDGSAQCSIDASFSTQPNEGESLGLRWEITDPLPVGSGGVIRFRCRVR